MKLLILCDGPVKENFPHTTQAAQSAIELLYKLLKDREKPEQINTLGLNSGLDLITHSYARERRIPVKGYVPINTPDINGRQAILQRNKIVVEESDALLYISMVHKNPKFSATYRYLYQTFIITDNPIIFYDLMSDTVKEINTENKQYYLSAV